MTTGLSPRARGGLLVLALALVGGMGCIAASAVNKAAYQDRMRESAEAGRRHAALRQQRIAALAPVAAAGDPVAQTALAYARLQEGAREEALQLLDRAAASGYGQAQAVLGALLSVGSVSFGGRIELAPAMRDAGKGIGLLTRAAAQACRYGTVGDREAATYADVSSAQVDPAQILAAVFERNGDTARARLWDARTVLHCGRMPRSSWNTITLGGTPHARIAALSLALLQSDRVPHGNAAPDFTPEDIAAARRDAADLRRRVAESERDYPAPKLKELP